MLSPTVQAPAKTDDRSAGSVRFVNDAASDFDRFTRAPSTSRKRWMRRHYYRQRVYSPYFDQRSRWFRRGWVYRDLYAIYKGSVLARRRPEWILRDEHGRRLYIPFDCNGSSCPQYAGDIGNPAFRRYWIRRARRALDDGSYAGLHVDDVNMALRVGNRDGEAVPPVDQRNGRPMTLTAWRRLVARFVTQIRSAFPHHEISHNPIWFVSDDRWVRQAYDAADWINLEQGVTDDGLTEGDGRFGLETFLAHVDRLHELGKHVVFDSYAGTRASAEYNLAAYLLVNGKSDGIRTEYRHTPRGWWASAYDLALGAADGPRYEWNGLLRRDFKRGYVLVNQPDRPAATVTTEGAVDLDRKPRSTVSLPGASGIVLLNR